MSELGNVRLLELRAAPLQGWGGAAKRALDIAVSIGLLLLFGAPILVLAALVRLSSPGPVLIRQERTGLYGQAFLMLKFRSMRSGAEEKTGPVKAQRADPRCTWLGGIMRRSSLDELPQLLNVLRGEMSLVGPRPERPHFIPGLIEDFPNYMARYNVKPGLTGWAQVNGYRGNTSVEKRLQLDLDYIQHWSVGFDIYILLITPLVGLLNRNAY